MENISQLVADNLKRLRKERKLSLDAVAQCSGVSKSMLGQIERGETIRERVSRRLRIRKGRRSTSPSFPAR